MKDIGARREGRKLRKEKERGIEKGGGEGEREWRHGRRGGKREKSMGPKGWQSFPSPLFFRFVRNKAATEYKVEPLPLVRKSFTSSLFSFPVRGLSTSLHKRELLLQMEYIVPPEYSLS